jgi:hypothetical protein
MPSWIEVEDMRLVTSERRPARRIFIFLPFAGSRLVPWVFRARHLMYLPCAAKANPEL